MMKKILITVVLIVLMIFSFIRAETIHTGLESQIIQGNIKGELLDNTVYRNDPAFIVRVSGKNKTYVLPQGELSDYYQKLIDGKIRNVEVEIVSYYYLRDTLTDNPLWGKELFYADTLTVLNGGGN